ncbi:MAG: hypothetical protein SOY27_05725 [Fournierella sp.]|uniref:hypothetical protein n=1 Tax=Allofournierella sp. TaxID=1940256 RepID=UPI002A7F0EF4|nr:hypothetical protein [Fournierella sp.]MDY4166975.1 hypothetical protein [Fournierella sp.]
MSVLGAALGRQICSFAQAYPGARDCTTAAMNAAIEDWFRLYFDREVTDEEDPCQRLPYTVVSKLSRSCFAEYRAAADGGEPFVAGVLAGLDGVRRKAMQLALIGGEAWLKPVPGPGSFGFSVMRRDMVTVLGRSPDGEATALGSAELTMENGKFYTLLERRSLDEAGRLVIENKLFCSWDGQSIGTPVGLSALPRYAALEPKAVVGDVGGLGLVSLRLPLENCVDGSPDPVSVYAAAAGLIHNINRNERQLDREFDHGESRVFASADLLDKRKNGRPVLPPGLFVGIDDDIANTGVTVFAPRSAAGKLSGPQAGVSAQSGKPDRPQAGHSGRGGGRTAHRHRGDQQPGRLQPDHSGAAAAVGERGAPGGGPLRQAGQAVPDSRRLPAGPGAGGAHRLGQRRSVR